MIFISHITFLSGPANENPVISSTATFKHPAGIDVLKVETGKKEIAFLCDKGNGCIRFIQNVQSITGDKFVGTVKIMNTPDAWKPEGLTLLPNSNTTAISASTNVVLLTLNASLTSGQLTLIVDNLQSPCGLCPFPGSTNTLLVADGNSVVEVNLTDKSIRTAKRGFKKAFDVAVSANGSVGVTDVYSHKLHILGRNANGEFENEKIIGSKGGCLDGPASKAQLAEPVGLCFDLDTAIISCFGGTSTGCIKLYTNVSCACNFMSNIRQIYDAIGFLPKIEQNQLMRQGKKINVPFEEGLQKLIDSLTYLQDVVAERKKYLHMATAGPEGTIYHISLEGFAETIKSLKTHVQAFDAVGLQDISTDGQHRHPTKQQYIRSKGQNEVELIKKTCKCPHSYHTNTFTAYQPTHASQLSSIEVIKQYGKWNKLLGPKDTSTTIDIQKQDLKTARMLNVLTKSRPCQNIRDLYRYKCGYGPCVIFQGDRCLISR